MAKLGPEASLLLSLVLHYKSKITFKNELLLFFSLFLNILNGFSVRLPGFINSISFQGQCEKKSMNFSFTTY